ncbi:MAG: hypothetical protein Q9216_001527 [Gyalolechia sp. 2 TL-2023]
MSFYALIADITVYAQADCNGAKHEYHSIHVEENMHSNIKKAESYKISEDLSNQYSIMFGSDDSATKLTVKANTASTKKGCYNLPGFKPDWFVVHIDKKPACTLWQEEPAGQVRRALHGCETSTWGPPASVLGGS